MDVNISNAATHQGSPLDEFECLGVSCNRSIGQSPEQAQNFCTVADIAARELANDERVRQNLVMLEQRDEAGLSSGCE